MRVAIAPDLSGDDIVIGSLNEIMTAGITPPHPFARRAARFLEEAWGHYTKFCFVQNPWMRGVPDKC